MRMPVSPPVALAVVFVGGGLGACGRYAVSRFMVTRYTGIFPLATALVNVTGSLLLGLILYVPALHRQDGLGLLAADTGLLGGYTTFSTAALEAALLVRDAGRARAAVVWLGGTAVGLAAAALGMEIGALLWPGSM